MMLEGLGSLVAAIVLLVIVLELFVKGGRGGLRY